MSRQGEDAAQGGEAEVIERMMEFVAAQRATAGRPYECWAEVYL